MKMNMKPYWDERTVLIYALLGGYTELATDEIGQAINDILNTSRLLYGSLDCLFELEDTKLINIELLDLEFINDNFLPRMDVRKSKGIKITHKPYTTLRELAADRGFGLGTTEKIIEGRGLKVNVKVNDSQAIRRKLTSYLADFMSSALSTGEAKELWSYTKQKAYILWRIQNEMKHFGNPMTLRLYEASKATTDNSRLFSTLFALVFEKVINVQAVKIDKASGVAYPQMPVYVRVHFNRVISDFAATIAPFEPEFAKELEPSEPDDLLKVGNLTLHNNAVECDSHELPLTPKELTVLTLLMSEYPRTVTNDNLRDTYFDSEYESGKLDSKLAADLMPSIYTTVKNLRKNLEQNGADVQIKTKAKTGYSLTKI